MARFIDIHSGFTGITPEQLREAHRKDQEFEKEEGVHFIKAWADPQSGRAFCLSEGPNKEAVSRVHSRAGHAPDEVHELSIEIE